MRLDKLHLKSQLRDQIKIKMENEKKYCDICGWLGGVCAGGDAIKWRMRHSGRLRSINGVKKIEDYNEEQNKEVFIQDS